MVEHVCLVFVLIQIVLFVTGKTAAASTHWCTVPDDTWVHADISPGHADLLSGCQDACRTSHNCTFCTISNRSGDEDVECLCSSVVYHPKTVLTQHDEKRCSEKYSISIYTVCDSGTYGITCENDCPPMCLSRLCDVISGECLVGCEDGWHGAKCERECGNCVSSTCNQSSGVCDDGCDHGWYSPTCTEPCSVHCSETGCSRDNGTCHGGCKPGWFKPVCTDTCPENCVADVCAVPDGACEQCLGGWFGPLCDRQCPQQCENLCDMLSGNCIEDWQYLDEEDLRDQWDCPENCFEGSCDNYTKACDSCNDGFWGELCDENCPVGCNASVCDIDNGECTDGCEIGWDGIECDQDIDECAGPIDGDSPCGNKHCYNTPGSYLCCSEGLVSRPMDTYMCYESNTSERDTPTSDFPFDDWARKAGLSRKSMVILWENDLVVEMALSLLTKEDIVSIGLTLGQRKMLTAAVQKLKSTGSYKHHPSHVASGIVENGPGGSRKNNVQRMSAGASKTRAHHFVAVYNRSTEPPQTTASDTDECAGPIDGDSPCGNKHCYNTPGSYLCCSEGLVSRPTDTYMCYDSSPPVWIWPVLVVCLLAGCVAGFLGHRLYLSKQVMWPWQKRTKEPNTMPMPDDIRPAPAPAPEAKLQSDEDDDDDIDYEDTGDITLPGPTKGWPLPRPDSRGENYMNRDMIIFVRETSEAEGDQMEVEYESVRNVEQAPERRYSSIDRRLQTFENKAYIN